MDSVAVTPDYGWALVKVLLSLVVVCAAALGLLRVVRRYGLGPARVSGAVEVLERVPLSPRQTLWLVRMGRRRLLLGATDQSIALLAEEPVPVADAAVPEDPGSGGA